MAQTRRPVTSSNDDSRAAVLGNVRRALRRTGELDDSVVGALEARLAQRPAHVRPRVEGDLTERFIAKARAVHATVERVDRAADVSAAVVGYLKAQAITGPLLINDEALLRDQEWPASLGREHRAAQGKDRVSVTLADAGIAETGTVILTSSANRPTSQNFLPDDHIVVLREERILPHLEDAWDVLRMVAGPPRTVNLITGPSKTADVEQTIQYGAHGPRRLHVILIRA